MAAFVNAIHPRDASVRSLGEPSSVEETRASLETRAKHAVASSPAHRVLVLRAVDECRGALETEGRQMAYLPNDLAVRLTEVQDMRACLVEGLVRNSLVWERSVSCTSRAVRYLDRFLGMDLFDMNSHEGWVYHLVSNACQSIAVKLTETQQVDPDALQQHCDVRFDKTCVLKMEALVLKELSWSIHDVVPATYASRLFYTLGFRGAVHDTLTQKSDLFALSILYHPTVCASYRPSAAAAAIVAVVLCDEFANVDACGVLRRVGEVFHGEQLNLTQERHDGVSVRQERHDGVGREVFHSGQLVSDADGIGIEPRFDENAARACVLDLETFREALANSARR